jgi:hypothetical protein
VSARRELTADEVTVWSQADFPARFQPSAYDLGITDIDPDAESYGPQLPTREDLDRATEASAAALTDPEITRAERLQLLEAEEAITLAYVRRPGAEAELEAGI